MYAALWTVNIIFNLIFGVISDRLGWHNVVMWFRLRRLRYDTLMFYYVPQFFGANYLLTVCAAGFVPAPPGGVRAAIGHHAVASAGQ